MKQFAVLCSIHLSQHSWHRCSPFPLLSPTSFSPPSVSSVTQIRVWLTQLPPWPWQSNGQEIIYAVSDSKLYVCLLPDQPEHTQRGGDRQNKQRIAELPWQLFCQRRHLFLLSSDSILIFFFCWSDFGVWSDPRILNQVKTWGQRSPWLRMSLLWK